MREVDTVLGPAATRRRGGASCALLLQLALDRGMTADRCLRGTGLTREMLTVPDTPVTAAQELRLIVNLVGELGEHHPHLGLEAGRRYHLPAYGVLGLAALSSATLGDAIAVGMRHYDLTFAFSPFRPRRSGRHGVIATAIDDAAVRDGLGAPVRRFLAEREMAAVVTFLRDLLGGSRHALEHVAFAHSRSGDPRRHREVLGVVPSFGRPETMGIVTRRTLYTPLPQADPRTAALNERLCAAERHRFRPRPEHDATVTRRIDALLAEALAAGRGLLSQRRAATLLHMSERTLRRALHAEGTRYSDLTDRAAVAAARDLLSAHRTVESVAEELGYSSASSFTHAFKRWTGTTPGQFLKVKVSA